LARSRGGSGNLKILNFKLGHYNAELNRDTTHFVSIYFDSANHKEIKIVLIIVRYFLPETGVHVKILALKDLPGETSTIFVVHFPYSSSTEYDNMKLGKSLLCNLCNSRE
jgi:hypothetical protein